MWEVKKDWSDNTEEVWFFDTEEEARAKAKEENEGLESSGYWWHERAASWCKFDRDDYPVFVSVSVYNLGA